MKEGAHYVGYFLLVVPNRFSTEIENVNLYYYYLEQANFFKFIAYNTATVVVAQVESNIDPTPGRMSWRQQIHSLLAYHASLPWTR